MPADIRDQKLLYHLTDINNLESILSKGLMPRKELAGFSDVADFEILESRSHLGLDTMVPFHFFARNPFDGRVQSDHPDKNFVLIAIHRDLARHNNWKIIPCHPLANEAIHLMDYNEGMSSINWGAMNAGDYHNEESKSVCMAECLAPSTVASKVIHSIFVKDDGSKVVVDQLISKSDCTAYVNVRPLMFSVR
jgi:hypothetical protein